MSVCRELLSRNPYNGVVDFARFQRLYPSRQLILRWFYRAGEGNDPFEQFMFLWLAFNGWAECVTDSDTDRQYLDALMQSDDLQCRFVELRQQDDNFAKSTERFKSFWPVFKVKELRQLGIRGWHTPTEERSPLIQHYLDEGATQFQPRCWPRHLEDEQVVPMDWPHTLAALYQVRCNLFHGEKNLTSEMDWQIVQSAVVVLSAFMQVLPGFTGQPYVQRTRLRHSRKRV